jgi:hypothetical protein
MATINAISNKTGTLTVDNVLTVTAGDATVSAGNIKLPTTTATTGQLQINAKRFLHNTGVSNTFVGSEAGNLTTTSNQSAGFGESSLKALTNGNYNTGLGQQTLQACTTGANNTAVGINSCYSVVAGGTNTAVGASTLFAVSGGGANSVLGYAAGDQITGGSYDVFLGNLAGHSYTGNESSNICIMNTGTVGESNKMRLGTDGTGNGQVDTTVIAGTNATISGAAAAGTVNIATGAGAKVVTLGSTNGASSLALQYGTADFTIASATGTVMSILDTGEMTMPLQPFVLAYSNGANDVTGDGTTYTVVFANEISDQNSDFDGTSTFTAPKTGKYLFTFSIQLGGILNTHTSSGSNLVTSNRTYLQTAFNTYSTSSGSGYNFFNTSVCADMDAADTAYFTMTVYGGTKVIDVANFTVFSAALIC